MRGEIGSQTWPILTGNGKEIVCPHYKAFFLMAHTAKRPLKAKLTKSLPPILTPNCERRSREYLTSGEVAALMKAAGSVGRNRHRDATMILIMYRHGLRVSELTDLRWEQVNLNEAILHVVRLKGGVASTHPLNAPQLRALKKLKKECAQTKHVFMSSRNKPISPSTVRKMVKRAGEAAGLPLSIHPHMLRHSCGYYLASKGIDTRAIQHYLGHARIQSTTVYTALSPNRFKGFWED